MPRVLLLCLTIVAAFPLRFAGAAPVEDAPLAGDVRGIAAREGIDPSRQPARFIADLTRALYPSNEERVVAINLRATAAELTEAPRVPVPLSADVWSRAVFNRTVPVHQLVSAILADRRAAYVARGLSGADDATLDYLAAHPAILRFLYERASAAFAGFGHALRIRDGRVVLPGGTEAEPLWEAITKASVTMPELFVPALFGEFEGRLAYVLDTIAAADPSAARFALGLWIQDPAARVVRFRALAMACATGFREWRVAERPFLRPLGDLAMLLLRVRLEPSGVLAPPATREFWASVFDSSAGGTDTSATDTRLGATVDAAWLTESTKDLDMYTRAERLDQFAFAQRVAAATGAGAGDLTALVAAFPIRRMLFLTIERMGARSIRTYHAALQRADDLEHAGGPRRFWTVTQYQGVLALLARMRRVGLLDAASSEALIVSVSAVPQQDGEYGGGIAEWLRTRWTQSLPDGPTWEARLISAIAGRERDAAAPQLAWEGQTYRIDLAQAERQRIDIVRVKQGGHTIDLALRLDAVARALRAPGATLETMRAARETLQGILADSQAALRRPAVNLLPPGVDASRDGIEWVSDDAQSLERAVRGRDLSRAARVSSSVQTLADIVLADALLSLAYAADIGDPEGAALLAGNVALRHDYGFGRGDPSRRLRQPWAQPRQDFQPGVPWHIAGSLLGLDVALAQLTLRRLTVDRVANAPRLPSTEREALAVGVSLLDARRLTDQDRDAITSAIARGRARAQALATDGALLDRAVAELGLDGWRERDLRWAVARDPANVMERFSTADLLHLGGTSEIADLDAWGTPGLFSLGCVCLRFPGPRQWRIVEGRFQHPMMAATMGDLTLTVASRLAELRLPAMLVRPVLNVAMQDFIDELTARNDSDWWSLSRQAQSVTLRRIEDYVAAAAAVDGPLIPDSVQASRD